jgi:hypothetical protein
MVALHGARNGDRLNARAIFSDSSSILTVELHFVLGAPSRLDAGTWNWARKQATGGSVQSRSVLFLGGQDGPPSIGGTFDLVDSAGAARYRVTIPATEVRAR